MSEKIISNEGHTARLEHLRLIQERAAAQLVIAIANIAASPAISSYPWEARPGASHADEQSFGPAQSVGFDI